MFVGSFIDGESLSVVVRYSEGMGAGSAHRSGLVGGGVRCSEGIGAGSDHSSGLVGVGLLGGGTLIGWDSFVVRVGDSWRTDGEKAGGGRGFALGGEVEVGGVF